MSGKRETWVDEVKIIACILVVLGHFYQSMAKSGILPESSFYWWFNKTIYFFHVPLFFICSGYLFQKYSVIRTVKAWTHNIWKKLLVLGIPYFVFSFATWLLKKLFESSVSNKVGRLTKALFVTPIAPYWYLYVLFFIFVVSMTAKKKWEIFALLLLTLVLKVISFFETGIHSYLIFKIMDNWIWFALGMALAFGLPNIRKVNVSIGAAIGIIFIVASIIYFRTGKSLLYVNFILGLMACFSVIIIIMWIAEKKELQVFKVLKTYTMPIFLMHTLFAAPIRSVLLKLGIKNAIIHIVVGLIIAFIGPIIAMIIMEKLHPLDFIVYPGRYLKKEKRN